MTEYGSGVSHLLHLKWPVTKAWKKEEKRRNNNFLIFVIYKRPSCVVWKKYHCDHLLELALWWSIWCSFLIMLNMAWVGYITEEVIFRTATPGKDTVMVTGLCEHIYPQQKHFVENHCFGIHSQQIYCIRSHICTYIRATFRSMSSENWLATSFSHFFFLFFFFSSDTLKRNTLLSESAAYAFEKVLNWTGTQRLKKIVLKRKSLS